MQRLLNLIAIVFVAACATASAQTQSNDSPPLIAGRLAAAEGDVQIWRTEEDGDGEWDGAQVNDVVTIGTGIYTGNDGRTEFRVGPNTFRLSANSRGGFSQLDYTGAVFNLENGSVNIALARPAQNEFSSVTVDGIRIDLAAPGRYRIDAGHGGPSRVTVFTGYASVQTGGNAINVESGQALVLGAGLSRTAFERATTTSLDQWASSRDDRYRNVQSARYVSPYMTGYEELDFHGDWIADADYGNVWVPRAVPVGWAPYRSGQWRWVRPWGWTWVDQAPWGYAPFHYGRWVTIGDRWSWWPGGHSVRPVWAPALVGFVGGSNVNVSVGFGGPVVGWYPLAPWHRYQPHYRHNHTYVTVINQTVIRNPPRGVEHHRNHEGATMVPGPRFRDPVMKVALPVRSHIGELQQMAPPPRNISPVRKFAAEDAMVRRPNQVQSSPSTVAPAGAAANATAPAASISKPTRIMPPMMAEPVPNRGVAAQPPLPGNNPAPLAQPPKFDRVPPTAIQTTPTAPAVAPEVARPQPRARMPQELLPQAEQNMRGAPSEPARFPPGAPPTMRQPKAPMPQSAPPVAALAPVQRAAPAPPVQRVAPVAAPPPAAAAAPPSAPPAAAREPSPREHVMRDAPRPKQAMQ